MKTLKSITIAYKNCPNGSMRTADIVFPTILELCMIAKLIPKYLPYLLNQTLNNIITKLFGLSEVIVNKVIFLIFFKKLDQIINEIKAKSLLKTNKNWPGVSYLKNIITQSIPFFLSLIFEYFIK